jgi:TonB family protein
MLIEEPETLKLDDLQIVPHALSGICHWLIGRSENSNLSSRNVALFVPASDDAETYINKIEQRIMAVWKLPSTSDGLKVVLRYNLARNGKVSSVRVEKTSGNPNFDNSALQARRRASPFPLPSKSFPIGDLRMVLEPDLLAPPKPARKTDVTKQIRPLR